MTYSHKIKPSDIYRGYSQVLKALEEKWEIIDFRPPTVGEAMAAVNGRIEIAACQYGGDCPRFIVRAIPAKSCPCPIWE